MRLWVGIHFHQLSLDVLRPRWSADMLPRPVAVLENDQVVAMTAAAASLGVRVGMRRRSVQAIAPQVGLMQRNPEREAQACQAAAVALLQYTPEVAQAEQGVVLLDVGASLRAFGGVRSLYRQVRHTVRGLGFDARIAMAPTAMGAWLLAGQALARRRRVLKMSTLAGRLNPLPCECLPAARPYLSWLQSIGCRTLGGLSRLPRAGLQRRTSPQLLQALDKAYEGSTDLFIWTKAPLVFDQRLPMPERTEQVELGLLAAEQLVQQMCGWLRSRQQAVCSLAFQLEHERGRHAIPPTELRIQLAGPAWRPEHLLRLLRERLARTVLPAPFLAVRLRAEDVAPCAPPTGSLFADPADTSQQARLLELLVARLGRDQVLQAAPRQDHRPEMLNAWQPAQAKAALAASGPLAWQRQLAAPTNLRPFWLLEQPVLLDMQDGCPAYGRDGNVLVLRLIRGPERIEAGWWSGKLTARDYFIAEDVRFTRYWIYRERDTRWVRWFLHGVFA